MIDISSQESKTPERYPGEPFDYVVTVCDEDMPRMSIFPRCRQASALVAARSAAAGTEEERPEFFRSVRERLRYRIEGELLNE